MSVNLSGQIRLKIRPDMLIDEKAYPNASPYRMFDEQSTVVSEPPTTKPVTTWANYISKELYYPLTAIIDLGRTIRVSNIYIYDVGGVANLSFYNKGATTWDLLFKDPLTGYDTWNKHTINAQVRYLRVISDSPDGSFPEVVIYGDQQTLAPVYNAVPTPTYPVMEDFIGVNILHVNDINYASSFKNIRQFHLWAWNEANTDIVGYPGYPNNQYGFNPSPGSYWNFDQVYKDYKDKGMRISPALQGSAFWLFNSTGDITDNKPIIGTEDPEKPASYIEHSDYIYQFVARYGKNPVATSKIKLRSDNTIKTAQGTIEGVENWNEPNKTWKGRAGLFQPFEYAAMTSADYDGHQGTLGTTVGAKNADPNIPFIMAGLTGMDTIYLKAMLYWFKQNRTDFKNPFNIINFHHYSNDAGGQIGTPLYGVSPEADGLEKKVFDVVGFSHRNLINKPIWITEFGYDVSQATSQRSKVYGSFLGEDVQAMWLVRSYLAICAGGADRAYGFWLQDDNSTSNELFGTCGIVKQVPPAVPTPRKSFYWLTTMNKVLGKYSFDSKVIDGKTYSYKFKSSLFSDTTIYCIWNGTSDGSTVLNYQLPTLRDKAILISPKVGANAGVQTPLIVANGKITLTVTENPVYVKVFGNIITSLSEQQNVSSIQIDLFPNPSAGITYVVLPQNMRANEVQVYDVRGSMVWSNSSKEALPVTEINTTNFENGIYNVKISGSGFSTIVKKLVVSK